ncbi:MAG: hypothetical protein ACJA2N_002089 [Salibacteraceae bacterium]|jgi:hypothetical protein
MTKIPISVLELATVLQGVNHAAAISNTVEIVIHFISFDIVLKSAAETICLYIKKTNASCFQFCT